MSSDHEYLINHINHHYSSSRKIVFHHPLKEIVWAQQELFEKKIKRDYINFKIIELSKQEEAIYILIKKIDNVKKSPGMSLYYFYKKFILN